MPSFLLFSNLYAEKKKSLTGCRLCNGRRDAEKKKNGQKDAKLINYPSNLRNKINNHVIWKRNKSTSYRVYGEPVYR